MKQEETILIYKKIIKFSRGDECMITPCDTCWNVSYKGWRSRNEAITTALDQSLCNKCITPTSARRFNEYSRPFVMNRNKLCYIYRRHIITLQFITAQEVDFLIISSLFSFLYLSTGEVANEKFWKNHRLLLQTPNISYPNFSSIHFVQQKKWISWLLAHYSHFYIFPVLLLEK